MCVAVATTQVYAGMYLDTKVSWWLVVCRVPFVLKLCCHFRHKTLIWNVYLIILVCIQLFACHCVYECCCCMPLRCYIFENVITQAKKVDNFLLQNTRMFILLTFFPFNFFLSLRCFLHHSTEKFFFLRFLVSLTF